VTFELLQERNGTQPLPPARPPRLVHVVCACSSEDTIDDVVVAFCGLDVGFDERRRAGDRVQQCRVCDDLAAEGCPMCGFGVPAYRQREARPE
jgi:hypothetical protein